MSEWKVAGGDGVFPRFIADWASWGKECVLVLNGLNKL